MCSANLWSKPFAQTPRSNSELQSRISNRRLERDVQTASAKMNGKQQIPRASYAVFSDDARNRLLSASTRLKRARRFFCEIVPICLHFQPFSNSFFSLAPALQVQASVAAIPRPSFFYLTKPKTSKNHLAHRLDARGPHRNDHVGAQAPPSPDTAAGSV